MEKVKIVKRVTAMMLATLCSVSMFAGCATSSTTASSSVAVSEAAASKAADSEAGAVTSKAAVSGKIVVGVLMKCQSDPFQRKLNDATHAALNDLKTQGKISDFVELDADSDVQKQLNQADDLIAKKVSVIVMAPQDSNGCAPIIVSAKAAGIPIVLVNSKTDNSSDANAFVGSNDVEAGQIMGNFIVSKLGGAGKAKGKVLHLQGAIGNSAQIGRGQGITNVFAKESGIKLVEELTAKWQRDEAMRITEDWLQKYSDIAAIVADNDDMSVGAMNAVMNAGRKKNIVIIGTDAIDDALTAVKAGNLDGTVFQNAAEQGKQAIAVAYDVASGKTVNKETMVPFVLITKDNISKYSK